MRANRLGVGVAWAGLVLGLALPGAVAAWEVTGASTWGHPHVAPGSPGSPARHGSVNIPHGSPAGPGPSTTPSRSIGAPGPNLPMGPSMTPGACQMHAKMAKLNLG